MEVAMTVSASALSDPYQLVSVQAVAPPNGTVGDHWHRYEITQGRNRIVGYRQGFLAIVKSDVEDLVLQLNERRLHHRGRVHVTLKSRSAPASRNTQASA